MDTTIDPLIGTTFEGRYRVEAQLGRGGFGAVYRAEQLGIGRPVALKVLSASLQDKPEERARFEQEARIIAAIDHPHIVKLVELGRAATGESFIAMELLEGESLAQRIRREGPLPEAELVALGRQALEALAEAHAAGVVHRDIKGDNLFLAMHPRRGTTLKLLDFGIAKASAPGLAGQCPRTRAGLVVGSPRVMAPEQICCDPVTPKTDLYAFGCVLYEMLTGRPPFVCRSAGAYAKAHLHERPPWPTRHGEPVTGPLATLVMQCLEKHPDARPASAEALLAAWPGSSASAPRQAPIEPPPLPTPAAPAPPDLVMTPRPTRDGATQTWRVDARPSWWLAPVTLLALATLVAQLAWIVPRG